MWFILKNVYKLVNLHLIKIWSIYRIDSYKMFRSNVIRSQKWMCCFCGLTKNCDAVSYHDGNTLNNFGKHLGDSKTSIIKIESSKYQKLVLLKTLSFTKHNQHIHYKSWSREQRKFSNSFKKHNDDFPYGFLIEKQTH